jgi:hypothetical protein
VANLEEGMPTVEQARTRLVRELQNARRDGVTLLKLIHGYGSSGVGGALKNGILGSLARFKISGEIQEFIAGENWGISNQPTWELLKQHPQLKADSDLGRANRGITVVLL